MSYEISKGHDQSIISSEKGEQRYVIFGSNLSGATAVQEALIAAAAAEGRRDVIIQSTRWVDLVRDAFFNLKKAEDDHISGEVNTLPVGVIIFPEMRKVTPGCDMPVTGSYDDDRGYVPLIRELCRENGVPYVFVEGIDPNVVVEQLAANTKALTQ